MKWLTSTNQRLRVGVGFAATAALAVSIAWAAAADPVSGGATNAPPAAATKMAKKLSGAELYSMHCNRCHPERYPTERTAAQWKTIVLHMRVRANIPGEQARTILKYMQENSGR